MMIKDENKHQRKCRHKYKYINKQIIFLVSVFYLLTSFKNVSAAINSATIAVATLQALPNCVHYQIRGICYWKDIYGINTTSYIEQYLPDVVVSVFNKPDDNPWTEINDTMDQAGKLAEKQITGSLTNDTAGSGQHSFVDSHEQAIFFKEADVIGNPALTLLAANIEFLPSAAMPLLPYYQSMLDAAAWRGLPQIKTPLAEEAYAVVADVTHHVGTFPINWGGIYPHEGKVTSSNDAKAAAVIAQRAGDLITTSNPIVIGHIFQPLPNQCGEECNATPIEESSKNTEFQMVYPIVSNQCDYFGKTLQFGEEAEQKTKGGAYVWVIWRHYKGCIEGVGQYIGKTVIN